MTLSASSAGFRVSASRSTASVLSLPTSAAEAGTSGSVKVDASSRMHPLQSPRHGAGNHRKQEDQEDENESSRPRLPVEVFVGGDRVGKDLDGERRRRL